MQDIYVFSNNEKEKIIFLRDLFETIKKWDRKQFKVSYYGKSLCLYTPRAYSDSTVNKYLLNNEKYIYKKSYHTYTSIPKIKINKNQILFLGKLYTFILDIKLQDKYKIDYDNLVIYSNKHLNIRQNLLEFYNKQAGIIFKERIKYYSDKLNLRIEKINIKIYKSIWGSINIYNRISLNERLILTPIATIDSIINHELAHYYYLDHSPAFYNKLEEIYPTYYKDHSWLNVYIPREYPPENNYNQ